MRLIATSLLMFCAAASAQVSYEDALFHHQKLGEYLNQGPSTVQFQVPNIVGLGKDEAGVAILGAALSPGNVSEEYHQTIPAGIVLSQAPAGGAIVDMGSVVNYAVSLGPELVVPPPVGDGDVTLVSGQVSAGPYGHGFGLSSERWTLRIDFQADGDTDLTFSFEAKEIQYYAAVIMSINGQYIPAPNTAGLRETKSGEWGPIDQWKLDKAWLVPGMNRIEMHPYGRLLQWGVRNLKIEPWIPQDTTVLGCPEVPDAHGQAFEFFRCTHPPDPETTPTSTLRAVPFDISVHDQIIAGVAMPADGSTRNCITAYHHAHGGGLSMGEVFGPEPKCALNTKHVDWIWDGVEFEAHAAATDGTVPLDAYNARRLSKVIEYVDSRWGNLLQPDIIIKGSSGGANACMTNHMTWPKWMRDRIVACDLHTGFTLPTPFFFQTLPNGGEGTEPIWDVQDLSQHWDEPSVQGLYITSVEGVIDDNTPPHPTFWHQLQEQRIPHCITRHRGGHQGAFADEIRPCEVQIVSLDKPVIAYHESTADCGMEPPAPGEQYGQPGHFNLGLGWDWGNIRVEDGRQIIPIRYQRRLAPVEGMPETGPGSGCPVMPVEITVYATVRRAGLTPGETVNWDYGSQSGTQVVDEQGAITPHLTMTSQDGYTELRYDIR